MNLMGWGRYPRIESTAFGFSTHASLGKILSEHGELIPYGNGRSYGDSALNSQVVTVRPHDYFVGFERETGLLEVQAGVLLSEILESFVPRGWFLKITPGTKFITVGGAIASDVHGKNHHLEGCFSECVRDFKMMLATGEVIECSREQTPEYFNATCGGQGLTGVILSARIGMKRINSAFIDQTSIKTRNLHETFEAFEEYGDHPYSVAWIDCLARGQAKGRSIIMVGGFRDDGDLTYADKSTLNVPFDLPGFAVSTAGVRAFNWIFYHKASNAVSRQRVDIDTFFYPLDAVRNWNRIYGSRGFTQYQFVIPKELGYRGLDEVLNVISSSGKGAFLAVLKLHGKANDNWLSFPLEGYSLALDFKVEDGVFELLTQLDEIVLKHDGRIYLAKDARVSKEVFEKGYPKIDLFRQFRRDQGMDRTFHSLQSKRVGI